MVDSFDVKRSITAVTIIVWCTMMLVFLKCSVARVCGEKSGQLCLEVFSIGSWPVSELTKPEEQNNW